MQKDSFANDEHYMRRAIELAKKGGGWTAPNPLVGAVIVKAGKIIGEGYHKKYGCLHAERNAFADCEEDTYGATLYVTLEPCCHYGKTPPCTDIIIDNKIARVVIGSRDPNPKVAGKGAEILRENGIRVDEDFMIKECDNINATFFRYITTGLPYVVMKYAMTLDGKIATAEGLSKWITGESAREHVHSMRGRYAAVMVGIGTVLDDDPMLNCRLEGAHQPVRVICDSKLRIPKASNICKTARTYRTIVACGKGCEGLEAKIAELEEIGISIIRISECKGGIDLRELIHKLGEMQIDSVLIEGGGTLNESAVRLGIVDHVCAYIAPKIFGGKNAKTPVEGEGIGRPDEALELEDLRITKFCRDILLEYDVKGRALCSRE